MPQCESVCTVKVLWIGAKNQHNWELIFPLGCFENTLALRISFNTASQSLNVVCVGLNKNVKVINKYRKKVVDSFVYVFMSMSS